MAARNLVAQFSRRHDGLPIWKLDIDPSGSGVCLFGWPTHNLGRITDALFRVEAATGAVVRPEVEASLRSGLRRVLDNDLGVASMVYGVPWERSTNRAGMFDGHSQREVLLGLTMLVRYRGDEWARASGAGMIDSLDRLINPDGSWDYRQLTGPLEESKEKLKLERLAGTDPVDLTYTHGRLIESLVEFYETTGYGRAVELASRLLKIHMASRPPAERVKEGEWVHHHSLFGTYRGIFRYGEITGDATACRYAARMLEEETLPRLTDSGYIPETEGAWDSPETSSPGDAAQLALWVASWLRRSSTGTGRPGTQSASSGAGPLLDHVERLVRARLLPSQILVDPGLRGTEDDKTDPYGETDTGPTALLRARAIGAYGGVHRHPYGHKRPTTDVTAATLHSVCDVLGHVLSVDDEMAVVDLLFDSAQSDVTVSTHTSDGSDGGEPERIVTVSMSRPRSLAVRVPGWVERESLRLRIGCDEREAKLRDRYVTLDRRALSEYGALRGTESRRYSATVRFALPSRTATEEAAGQEFRLDWRGDEVFGVAPNAPFLPFYPTLDA